MIENNLICYVCKKPIKKRDKYIHVGKNFEGQDLHRHKKCKPYNLSKSELKIRKHWVRKPGTIIQKDKRRKSRQKQKIELKNENNS